MVRVATEDGVTRLDPAEVVGMDQRDFAKLPSARKAVLCLQALTSIALSRSRNPAQSDPVSKKAARAQRQ